MKKKMCAEVGLFRVCQSWPFRPVDLSIGKGNKLQELVVEEFVDFCSPQEVEVIEGRHVDPVEALQVGQSFGKPRHVLCAQERTK